MRDCEADIIEQEKSGLFFNPHKFLVAINTWLQKSNQSTQENSRS